jgi:serine/threonine protein kinase
MKSEYWHQLSNNASYQFRHKNIITYKEAFFEDNPPTLCLIMELADDGDLDKRI